MVKNTRLMMGMVLAAIVLAGCGDKGSEAKADGSSKSAASTAKATASAAASATAKAAEQPVEASLPKLGKLDEVDYETLKKSLTDAGFKVGGSATKSAMYSMNLTLEKGETVIKLWYYKDGGDSWKKRLEKDGAEIHEAGNVLVGVKVEKGNADAKKVLAALLP